MKWYAGIEQPGGRKPEVALWIITHPHMDHYGAIQAIGRDPALAERVSIRQIVYRFPMEFTDKAGNPGMLAQPERDLAEICASTGAAAHCPERDEQLDVDGTVVRFLYVPDDCSALNTGGGNANCCSLIFTVQGKEKKTLITGDAYARAMHSAMYAYSAGGAVNLAAEAKAEQVYKAFEGTVMLAL